MQVKNCSKCHRTDQCFFKNVTGQVNIFLKISPGRSNLFQNFTGQGQILKIIKKDQQIMNKLEELVRQRSNKTLIKKINYALIKLKKIN